MQFAIVKGTPNPIDLSDATKKLPTTQVLKYTELLMGSQADSPIIAKENESLSGDPNKMVVQAITLAKIIQTGNPNEYKGEWTIKLKPSTTMQAYQPITLEQIFVTSGPAASSVILGCGSSGGNPTFYAEQLATPTGPNGSTHDSAGNPLPPNWPLATPHSFFSTKDMDPGIYTIVVSTVTRPHRCGTCSSNPATFTFVINGVASPYAPTAAADDEGSAASLRGDTFIVRNVIIPWPFGAQPLRFEVQVTKSPNHADAGLEALAIQAIKQ